MLKIFIIRLVNIWLFFICDNTSLQICNAIMLIKSSYFIQFWYALNLKIVSFLDCYIMIASKITVVIYNYVNFVIFKTVNSILIALN